VLGLWGLVRAPRAAGPIGAAAIVVILLWIWSIGQTAGGWIYSARVLNPAVALFAVAAAGPLTRLSARATAWLGALILVLSADAAFRSFYLPDFPLVSPSSYLLKPSQAHHLIDPIQSKLPFLEVIAREAGSRSIIVDDPNYHAAYANLNAWVIPLMSPEISFLFDDNLSFSTALAKLRERHVRFIMITRYEPLSDDFDSRHPFLRELKGQHKPIYQFGNEALYDLDFMSQ